MCDLHTKMMPRRGVFCTLTTGQYSFVLCLFSTYVVIVFNSRMHSVGLVHVSGDVGTVQTCLMGNVMVLHCAGDACV